MNTKMSLHRCTIVWVLFPMFLFSCSSIVKYEVITKPEHAKIILDGNYVGVSPYTGSEPFAMPGHTYVLEAHKEGYETAIRKFSSNKPLAIPKRVFLKLQPIDKKVFSESRPLKQETNHQTPTYLFDIGDFWAVIIGISRYRYSNPNGLSNLKFADDDAKSFARSLRNLGWSNSHIKLLINEEATQRNVMIALESWLSKTGPKDQIVLFWAGHGFPDPEDPEKIYLACYDTDISIPANGYRMDNVITSLREKDARNVVLFADTCHAGKLITRSDGSRGISIIPKVKNQNLPKGWVYMVGADTDRQAVEHSSWSNGAFTHSLLTGLNGAADGFESAGPKDGIVTMGELRSYMKTAMPEKTQKILGVAKHPVITTSTGDPAIWNLTLQVSQ